MDTNLLVMLGRLAGMAGILIGSFALLLALNQRD
jgi:hypothetical protein